VAVVEVAVEETKKEVIKEKGEFDFKGQI